MRINSARKSRNSDKEGFLAVKFIAQVSGGATADLAETRLQRGHMPLDRGDLGIDKAIEGGRQGFSAQAWIV
jgi:hypothetical protein